MAALYAQFAAENAQLLAIRDALQAKIHTWHDGRAGQPIDPAEYQTFLREVGYLVEEPAPFTIAAANVDEEVAKLAGPQLLVPLLNARFLLNAANARWGTCSRCLTVAPLPADHLRSRRSPAVRLA